MSVIQESPSQPWLATSFAKICSHKPCSFFRMLSIPGTRSPCTFQALYYSLFLFQKMALFSVRCLVSHKLKTNSSFHTTSPGPKVFIHSWKFFLGITVGTLVLLSGQRDFLNVHCDNYIAVTRSSELVSAVCTTCRLAFGQVLTLSLFAPYTPIVIYVYSIV